MSPDSADAPTPIQVRFGRFELDEANASLMRDGRAVAIAPTPFAVLCALVRQPGTLLSKNALLDQVWGHQFVSDSVLKTVISELRTLFDDDARKPRFIETVSRRGYRFVAAAMTPTAAAGDAGASRSGSARAPSFIGREEALGRLRRGWDMASSGKRAVVWVAGEPGIGKTTLIEQFVEGVGEVAVARGQCMEHYGSGEPYLPVLEALAQLCRRDSVLAALLHAVAPTWLLQLPWLCSAGEREALQRELSGISPHRMLREMGELLDRYTQERPLLLVTEDLHWGDRGTVQLMDYVARRRGNARLMWLASFRPAEVIALDHPLNPVRHELRLHGLCEEIMLDPFSEAEVADYVAQRSASLAGDDAFVRTLHERTDGVPLFVASVVSEAAARFAQGADGEAAARLVGMAVPENLTAIIDHYVARLDSEQRALLSVAAVCGIEFRVTTVSDALEREAGSVGMMCEALARAQLWLNASRDGALERPYAFRHALFRQVLYKRIAPAARAQIHRQVGAALERERAAGVPVSAVELATHFECGRDPMTALRYYAEAAGAALLHLSAAQGMSLTERGLILLEQAPQGAQRDALEITLSALRGVAAFQLLGVGPETKSAFMRAYGLLRQVPQHPLRPLVKHGYGFVLCLRAEYAEALAVAERAEELSSATNRPVFLLSACTVQGQVHMLQGRPHAARGWLERGLEALQSVDAAPDEAFVTDPHVMLLGLLSIQLLHLGFVQQAHGRIEQAYARARQLGQPVARMIAIWCDALLEVRLGNPERVAALADEMQALVDRFAVAQGRTARRWFGGWAEARLGQPREGYRRIREAHEENVGIGMLAGGSENLGYAAEALLLAGDWDAAEAQLREALQFASTRDERIYLPQLLQIEAGIARARGEPDVADASIRRAIAEARGQEAPWLELLARIELCEHQGATAEDRGSLADLVDRLPEAAGTAAVSKARALLEGTKSRLMAA
jgi:DNA-binding winged helix-turn-helix (wHTH) protein/tetratricopeptide (TPR) repeat protein